MKRLCLKLIRFYQKYMSKGIVSQCRYTPTCSQYAYEAILKWGVVVGILLGSWRILRCNPLSKGGFDKVPDKPSVKKWVL